ncbi:MAG: M20/M25/M40 family metallo-hydrolase [Holophaga sp.]|nr:M20/M25/M40 family metallo-hydrolase [Holophaga sp.]
MTPEALLQKLVSIPSLSGEEHVIATFVADLAASWGFRVHRHLNNLWFEVGTGSPRLLLVSHLDTVKPCAGWLGDPWQTDWQNGVLTGLGANDAKGCVAALLMAARSLAMAPPDGTLVFAFTAEEETGGAQGMGEVLSQLGSLDAAFVGEPTALEPCIAQRGMLILGCTARGESGHVAHARLAENAIHKAARDITRLAGMVFEPDERLGSTKPQVTLIQGGLARNQVPDVCEFSVDLRTTPNLDHAALSERIARELESEVKVISTRYIPKATAPQSAIAQAALLASGRKVFVGSATTSDWAFLGQLPAIKIGPGDTHRSHRANEFITREELHAGVAFYQRATRLYFAQKEAPCGA